MSSQNEDIPYFLFIVLLQCLFLNQVFCNLHRIQCSPFFDLVTYNPECQSVLIAEVLTDTTNVNRVFAGEEQRHGIFFFCRVVHQNQAVAFGKCFASFFSGDGTLCLLPRCFRSGERRAGTRTQVALTLRQSA